jgi:cyclopropane fatty-acyl-phospholipid synthase-like methyltransferase
MTMEKPDAPSVARNRDAILDVLVEAFAQTTSVLEVGSGTGQHAVFFARALPHLSWQTSDREENLDGISAWLDDAGLPNTPPALAFDVNGTWPTVAYDGVFTANTLHIMSLEEVQAFFAGLPGVTSPHATLVVYGPFNYDGQFTSPSNAAFNDWLQARGAHMAIRDFEAVDALAANVGFELVDDRAMPANNRCITWRRRGP